MSKHILVEIEVTEAGAVEMFRPDGSLDANAAQREVNGVIRHGDDKLAVWGGSFFGNVRVLTEEDPL